MYSYEVYKVTNKVNNKVYIGITNKGAGARFKQHLFDAEHGSQYRFHRAIRKYGKENFEVSIIAFCNNADELKENEIKFISEYESMNPDKGYNMTEGGDGTFGRVCTLETRLKISEANKGKEVSEETRKLLSERGKVRTEGRDTYWSSGTIGAGRRKPILQYDENGIFVKEYDGIRLAEKETGISFALITSALKKRNVVKSKVNPYIWVYKEDYPDVPETVDPSLIALCPEWKPVISEACRQANLEARKNKVYSEEEKAAIKQRATEACGKKVEQYTVDGELIATFNSISEAARSTKQDAKTISNWANGKTTKITKQTKFVWKYKTEQSNII
jgi:group I intron endonuclease